MEALASVLLEEERFSDAAEVMLDRANAAEAEGRRAELLLEVARVYAGSLGDTTSALGHYEGVLMADSGQMAAIRDLVTMAGRPDDHEAVAALVLPHLDQRGRYKDLAIVLEARSRLAADAFDGIEALKQLAGVRWERLHDPEGSLDAYNQLMDRVQPDELGPVLSQAARLSVRLGRAEAHVDALAQRAANEDLDPQARVQIALSAADISEEIMGDKTRALALLAPLVEAGLGGSDLCKSVERLARSLGDKALMAMALRELAGQAEGGQERAEILVRLGDAELGADHREPAMTAYRDALDVIPGFAGAVAGLERILEINEREGVTASAEVLDSLDRAYQDAGNKPGLVRLTRMRLEGAEGEELLRLLELLAQLIDEGGGKPRESLEVWGNLIMRDAENESALARVSELAKNRPLLSDAIHFMAAAIDAAQGQKRPCFGLCIATTTILLEQIGDPTTALRALKPALVEKPDSPEALQLQIISSRACKEHATLHGALTHYASLLDIPEEAVPFWREAADVASGLGNLADVRRDLEQLIELEETDEAAWHKWLEVLAQSEAWDDLADGLGRRATITENEEEQHILRHHLARLLVDRLDRVDDAINTYHDMLAARPEDLDVISELYALLRRHERWGEVREVLERKAEHVQGEVRVGVLEELAQVVAVALEEPSEAIEIYHRILAEQPGHKGSLEALEQLLGAAERWVDLAQIKDNRIAPLREEAASSETAAAELLQSTLSLAVLLADRLSEEVRARALLDEVLAQDPDNVAGLLCLAKVQQLTGDAAAMAETLARAMTLDPQGPLGSELRVRMAKLTEVGEERREHLEQALHLDPQNLEAANLLLTLSRDEGYWEQVAYLLALVASFDTDADSRRALELERIDILSARLGQHEEVLQALAPIYEEVQDSAEINQRIANALFASERFEEARGMYTWLIEMSSSSGRRDKRQAQYLTRLARIVIHLQLEDESEDPLKRLKEAYRIDTTNAETLVTLTDLYSARSEWKEALKLARTMLLQNVDRSGIIRRGDIYMRLANAHLQLQEHSKAISMLRRGKQEDPEHAEVGALLEQLQNQG
jgi:tetratricopeptide (TPR) repeat protein